MVFPMSCGMPTQVKGEATDGKLNYKHQKLLISMDLFNSREFDWFKIDNNVY